MIKLFRIIPFALTGLIMLLINYVFIFKSLINYESINTYIIVKMIFLLIIPIVFFHLLTVYVMKKSAEYIYYHSFRFMSKIISDFISTNFENSEDDIDKTVNNWIQELKPPLNNVMTKIVSKISLKSLIIDAKCKYPSQMYNSDKEFRIRLTINYVVSQINDLVTEHFSTTKFSISMFILTIINITIFFI